MGLGLALIGFTSFLVILSSKCAGASGYGFKMLTVNHLQWSMNTTISKNGLLSPTTLLSVL